MKISDLIEQYINEIFEGSDVVELNRSSLADMFNCVPSQINYVISTRFIPELGFYVESRRGGGGYIKTSTNINSVHQDISMHRFIMGITDSKIRIDHINGNKKDNRKSNLRIATASQNGINRGKNINNTT